MKQIQPLTIGPIVGHTDTNQVRIWGRAKYEPLKSGFPRRVFGVARIKKQNGGGYGSPKIFKMNPNFDLTGLFVYSNLKKETHYTYQMGWFFSDKELDEINSSDSWDWSLADQGEFQSTSDDPTKERDFIFGSCRYLLKLFGGSWFDSRGDKTFRSINEKISNGNNINKLLMIGDQIYADDLNFLAPDKQVEEFYSRYRDAFSQKNIKKLMSNVSTYMTLARIFHRNAEF